MKDSIGKKKTPELFIKNDLKKSNSVKNLKINKKW